MECLMSDERLPGLALMHLHYDLDIDVDEIYTIVVTKHKRRMFQGPRTELKITWNRDLWEGLWGCGREVICHKEVQQSFLNQSLEIPGSASAISANAGLKYNFLPFLCSTSLRQLFRGKFCLIITASVEVKAQHHFVSLRCIPSLEEPGPGLLKCRGEVNYWFKILNTLGHFSDLLKRKWGCPHF